MKRLYFKCTFLSEVMLNKNSATAGSRDSLDYIPGSQFLGLVAQKHFAEFGQAIFEAKIRFSDAQPCMAEQYALRLPASWAVSKGVKFSEVQDFEEDFFQWHQGEGKNSPKQPKQLRSGYFTWAEDTAALHTLEGWHKTLDFQLKAAYNRAERRPKDEAMYGYQSFKPGLQWFFWVEVEDETQAEALTQILVGKHSIGKSRSAQYGRVEIDKAADFQLPAQDFQPFKKDGESYHYLYALSNLCFLDEQGQYTTQPCAEKLGFEGGEIDWTLSQVRTRTYASWNGKRQYRNAERWIIEKGSVLVLKGGVYKQSLSSVGLFAEEGFGKVLVNPHFLRAKPQSIKSLALEAKIERMKPMQEDLTFLKLLKKEGYQTEQSIEDKVTEFMEKHKKKFEDITPSQWGQVRSRVESVALKVKEGEKNSTLNYLLFHDKIGYLATGKSAAQWQLGGRTLEAYVHKDLKNFEERSTFLRVLAAEMAKAYKARS